MKLSSAFYCPDCQEVFDNRKYRGICPACANRFCYSVQKGWSYIKEENYEKDNHVFVTPVRYNCDRCSSTINSASKDTK
jgi:predicted amidophosphoribosyltransferase